MKKIQLNSIADLVISIDDYHPRNIEIAQKIKALGLSALFYIEVKTDEGCDQVKKLNEFGMEIGSHTINHYPDMKLVPQALLENEILGSKKIIESITGVECEDLAYPRGRYNEAVIDEVIKAGYKTARGTKVLSTTNVDPYRLNTTIHVYSGRKEYHGAQWYTMADFYLNDVIRTGGTFHIWGHAQEMIKNGDLGRFYDFLGRLQDVVLWHRSFKPGLEMPLHTGSV